jgi:hypothetical protein
VEFFDISLRKGFQGKRTVGLPILDPKGFLQKGDHIVLGDDRVQQHRLKIQM